MKCQKCSQPSVVHLTELLTEGGVKKAVELHLCYDHAIEAGLISSNPPQSPLGIGLPVHAVIKKKPKAAQSVEGVEMGIPIEAPPPGPLTVVRRDKDAAEILACPICGNTWAQFKQTGIMGCAFDYVHFESRIMPLVKRAQEGGVQHAGKVPSKIAETEVTREVTTSRLRRDLQRAVDAEKYEDAARLRDELKKLGTS